MTRKCTEVQTDQSGLLRVCFHPFAVLYSPLRAPWHLKAAFNIYINLLLHQCQLSCEISGLSPPNSNLTHALSRVWWHCHPDPSFFGSYCAVPLWVHSLIPHTQQRSCLLLEFITTSGYSRPIVSQGEINKQGNHLEAKYSILGRPKGRIMHPRPAWAAE